MMFGESLLHPLFVVIFVAALATTMIDAQPSNLTSPRTLVVWTQSDDLQLAAALANVWNTSSSSSSFAIEHAFISITPIVGDKTRLRPASATQALRSAAPPGRINPLAEFHFPSWSKFKQGRANLSWTQIACMFRQEMVASGYNTEAGDSWEINEAPSSFRRNATFRAEFLELLSGLAHGCGAASFRRGIVFEAGFGERTTTLNVYHDNMKSTLSDASFWKVVGDSVALWSFETYTDSLSTCEVPQLSGQQQAQLTQSFNNHPVDLLVAGQRAGVSAIRPAVEFLIHARGHSPLLNGVMGMNSSSGYGDTNITLANMKAILTQQIAGLRSWWWQGVGAAGGGSVALGFGVRQPATPSQVAEYAATVVDVLMSVPANSATSSQVCNGDSACVCNVSGAVANLAWNTAFKKW